MKVSVAWDLGRKWNVSKLSASDVPPEVTVRFDLGGSKAIAVMEFDYLVPDVGAAVDLLSGRSGPLALRMIPGTRAQGCSFQTAGRRMEAELASLPLDAMDDLAVRIVARSCFGRGLERLGEACKAMAASMEEEVDL